MKKALIFSIVVALAAVANANSASLTFNGSGPYSYQGTPTYPYNFTVDGNSEALMCIGFNEHITGGEQWMADVLTVQQYGSLISNNQLAYELGYLYVVEAQHGGAIPEVNAAAWYLAEGAPSLTPAAQHWVDVVTAINFPDGSFPALQVYVPIPGTESWVGEAPQVFYGGTPTPEPGTLMLLGGSLLGSAGVIRKRFLRH